MKKKGKMTGILLLVLAEMFLFGLPAEAAAIKTIYSSPYIGMAPDGKAWTFDNAKMGGTAYKQYPNGTTVYTGETSALRALNTGEHYYGTEKNDTLRVGKWVVKHAPAQCIHNMNLEAYHGIAFGENICGRPYYSGWWAYCADCGEPVLMNMYATREAVSSLNRLPLGMDFYYLCPWCSHLEMGAPVTHECKAISWNRYRVQYKPNKSQVLGEEAGATGKMTESYHMYNNATVYEGRGVTPNRRLNRNTFEIEGYSFVDWNTAPDGSGTAFGDGEEILNLSSENYDEDAGTGTVTLYAQWVRTRSTLVIDPNGGSYDGENAVTEYYGTTYSPDAGKLMPPAGYTVTFDTRGGSYVAPETTENTFKRWRLLIPHNGVYLEAANRYQFLGPLNGTDTLQAVYTANPVTLAAPSRDGYIFSGWYSDPECTRYVGGEGDTFLPDADTTLYAGWAGLELQVDALYYRDTAVTDERTKGSIYYGVKDREGKADNAYGVPSDSRAVQHATGAVDIKLGQERGEAVYRLWMSSEESGAVLSSTYGALRAAGDSKTVSQSVWQELDTGKGTPAGEPPADAVYEVASHGTRPYRYTVEADGLYTITAAGGRGGSCGVYEGGGAGEVSGIFYLKKGDVLTVTLGEQGEGTSAVAGGYPGGACGIYGGSGGSATRIQLTDTGGVTRDLIVAAGGGGASPRGVGYAASPDCASADTLSAYRAESAAYHLRGESAGGSSATGPGGGGGILGGLEGELIYHSHEGRAGLTYSNGCYTRYVSGHAHGDGCYTNYCHPVGWDPVQYLECGCQIQEVEYRCSYCGASKKSTVYNSIPCREGHYGNQCRYLNTMTCHEKVFTCTREESSPYYDLGCGKTTDTIESFLQAHGGLSYLDTAAEHYAGGFSFDNGHRGGGKVSISAKTVGFSDDDLLLGIPAGDMANPDKISHVQARVTEDNTPCFTWEAPRGNGTAYYFFAESYKRNGTAMEKQLTTGIVSRILDAAIAGYYYISDDSVSTDVRSVVETTGFQKAYGDRDAYTYSNRNAALSKSELGFTQDACLDENDMGDTGNRAYHPEKRYVHIAAVDVAGNVADTFTVDISGSAPQVFIPWKVRTKQLSISSYRENGSVYRSPEGTVYVKADNETEFLISSAAVMEGKATPDYQIDEQSIRTELIPEGRNQDYQVRLPYTGVLAETEVLDIGRIVQTYTGEKLLGEGSYMEASRTNNATENFFAKTFTMDAALNGKTLMLIPGAGASYRTETGETAVSSSDPTRDAENSLTLVADGEAPVITGMENLEDGQVIDRMEEDISLVITATDALSGVKELSVTVSNTDNFAAETYISEEGVITLEITEEEPLYTGNFTVTAVAVDNVGNRREVSAQVTEFALDARIERILAPHEPEFKRGESGILYITTYGYAERVEVEFPAAMREMDERLQRIVINYAESERLYCQEAQIQFMVPLYLPEDGEYTVTVRAYKDEKRMEKQVPFAVIWEGGTILDEFRTRLR